MSEVVWSSSNVALPRGYEKLDGIEVVKQKDDGIRFNGLMELGVGNEQTIRKVQLPDPLEMWGYDPDDRQVVQAKAIINGQEMPVTVIGIAGKQDGRVYYQTKESGTGIEASQIQWLHESKTESDVNNTEIEKLQAALNNLQAEKAAIEAERDNLKNELNTLQQRFDDLEAMVSRIQSRQGAEDPDNPPTDIEEGERVNTLVSGQIVEGTVIGEPFYRNNKWHYRIRMDSGLILEPSAEELNQWQDIDTPPQPIPPQGDRPPRARRTDYLAFWRPRGLVETRPVYRDGIVTQETEEVFVRESDNSRRGRIGAVIVSVLALAGIGYTLHEVEEIEHRQAKPSQVEQFLKQQNSILQNKVKRIGIQEARQLHRQKVILANQADIEQKLDTLHIHVHKYGNNFLDRIKDLQVREKEETKQAAHGLGYGSAEHHTVQNAELGYRGDTVWNEVAKRVREKLGSQANASKIKKATDYVLRLNGLRWNGGGYGVDAHKLPVGFRFKIPDNIGKIAS